MDDWSEWALGIGIVGLFILLICLAVNQFEFEHTHTCVAQTAPYNHYQWEYQPALKMNVYTYLGRYSDCTKWIPKTK